MYINVRTVVYFFEDASTTSAFHLHFCSSLVGLVAPAQC